MNRGKAISILHFLLGVMGALGFGCTQSQDNLATRVATTDDGRLVRWVYSAGKLTAVFLSDQSTNDLVRISLTGDYARKHTVSIFGSNDVELAKTDFSALNEVTSWTSPLVSFTQFTSNDSSGRSITRRWWHQEGYLLIEETLLIGSNGRVNSVSVKGPLDTKLDAK